MSLQSALAHHGMIPEGVPVTTSVTTARPMEFDTPFGRYSYRHIRPEVFFGYGRVPLPRGQEALLAGPEKALLDLVYLTPKGEDIEHLKSLRLEGIEDLGEEELRSHGRRWGKEKIHRSVEHIIHLKEIAAGRRGQP